MEVTKLAEMISEGTTGIIEAAKNPNTKRLYNPDLIQTLENPNSKATPDERKIFTDNLVGSIQKGAEEQKEYNAWYEKTYGSKFQR